MEAARIRRAGLPLRGTVRPLALAVALACSAIAPAHALSYTWLGGNGNWNAAASWTPAGGPPSGGDDATLNAGSATVSAESFIRLLTLHDGAIRGPANLVASGLVSYTGGQIGGDGGQVIANGGLAIGGAATKTLGANGGAVSSGIVNNAAAIWSGSGDISNWASGRFTNGATGSLDIQTDADFLAGTFVNQGRLVKSVGAGGAARTVFTSAFTNTGSVNVQQGVLSMTNGGSHTGSFSTGASAWLEFAGGNGGRTHDFNAGSSITGNARFVSAFTASVINTGATYNTTRTEILDNGLAGTLKVELTSLASFDQLAVTDDVTLGGDLSVWNLGYVPQVGDTFIVLTFDQRLANSTFATVTANGFAPGTVFQAIYEEHDVRLSVVSVAVPEPGSALLLLAGCLGIAGVVRRRRQD